MSKKYWAVFLTAVVLAIGCGGSGGGVTGTPVDMVDQEGVTTVSVQDPPQTAAATTTIQINARGVITNSTEEVLRACLYDAPYGAGELIKGWRVGQGTTPFQWKNDTCFPQKVQLDVVGDTTCPNRAIFQDFRDGRIFKVPAGKTGEECEECVEAPVETVVCTECPSGDVKPEDCNRTCTKTIDYQCKEDVTTTFIEACVCKTSCVEEGPYTTEQWFPEVLKGKCPTPSASCREECHQLGETTLRWDCTDPSKEPLCRPIDCPKPEGVCYYTPDCRNTFASVTASTSCPDQQKRLMCQNAGGSWANWNGQNNQCKTSLPGIYESNFRLVPGQSHTDCLKFTGN